MADNSNLDETASGDRSERIREVIIDCLRRRTAGETVSDQSIIDTHPDLMPDLADELRKLGLVEAAWERAVDGEPHDEYAETLGPAGLHIRCPHCHNPVEVVLDTQLTDIVCSACGSHFSFVDDDNTCAASTVRTLGHFETIERLGTGAFGAVWKARDTELDRTVALKIPRKGQLTPAEAEQFLREARAAAQLRHPNIVSVHEVGREGDTLFIVSDLVRGVSLSEWLSATRLTSREAAELCVKIAKALHHAHEAGVIHRDLKPSNIMMDASGEPHIMDFGLAKREAGEITVTLAGRPLGTPAYMSPEQAQGQAHLTTGRSDVYSLGVIFFKLLTGELPFRGNMRMVIHQVIHDEAPGPRKLNNSIPRDLETICLKCLQKEPSRRFASAADLAEELSRFLRGEPILARPIGRATRLWRWCKRKPVVAGLSGAVVLLLLTLGIAGPVMASRQATLRLEADTKANEAFAATQKANEKANEANENFIIAHDTVVKYLIQVENSDKLKSEGLEPLRRELLTLASGFFKRLIDQDTDNEWLVVERALAHIRLALINVELGDLDESERLSELAQRDFKDLVARHPESHLLRSKLAGTYGNLGIAYRNAGQIDQSIRAHEAARSEFSRLLEVHPDDREGRRELARSHYNLATAYLANRQLEDAIDEYNKSADQWKTLVDRPDSTDEDQMGLASTHGNLGAVFTKQEAFDEAMKHYLLAEGALRSIGSNSPDASRANLGRGLNYNNMGLIHAAQGRYDDAKEAYEKALTYFEPLAEKHDQVAAYLSQPSRVHYNLGLLHHTYKQMDAAESEYKLAVEGRTKLVSLFPGIPEYENDLASSQYNLGLIYSSTKRMDVGYSHLDDALRTWENMEARPPQLLFETMLPLYRKLQKHLLRLKKDKELVQLLTRAVATLEKDLGEMPADARGRVELHGHYLTRATVYERLGQYDDAVSDCERAYELAPSDIRWVAQLKLARLNGKQGDYEGAAYLVDTLVNAQRPSGPDIYNTACVYAQLSAAAAADKTLSDDERNRNVEKFASRALSLLKQAADVGFFSSNERIQHMNNDEDLLSIRDREDFRVFLSGLHK